MRAFLVNLLVLVTTANANRPNIVIIIADDLGWNDVGFHGMNQVPTPNIDALAWSGTILNRHYVNPVCTPSRAALMTGKYAFRLGMQHSVLFGMEPRGLPLSEKLLPQYMKELGYKTHLVGKWHLGSYKREHLPLNRGFDSHLGFWTGRIDMYEHTNIERGSWGFDFRRNYEVAHDYYGQYVTDIYTEEAEKVIAAHNKTHPLFLVVAHSAVHSGNPHEPIRAPDHLIETFSNITDYQRRKFAAVLSKLDDSVGKTISSLEKHGLLKNSVVLFTTDNGGCPAGFNFNAGSNYPLRGTKGTFWEGGTRGTAVLWSPLLKKRSRVAQQRLHLTDWLPTLFSVAGGNVSLLQDVDGVDQWAALSNDENSTRTKIVYNLDASDNTAAISVNEWKLVSGQDYNGEWDSWFKPAFDEGKYSKNLIYNSWAGRAIDALGLMPSKMTIDALREEAKVTCDTKDPPTPCDSKNTPCLYNLLEDPCERYNVVLEQPEIVKFLQDELLVANRTAIAPTNLPVDKFGDPKNWGRVYTNFGDFEHLEKNKAIKGL